MKSKEQQGKNIRWQGVWVKKEKPLQSEDF